MSDIRTLLEQDIDRAVLIDEDEALASTRRRARRRDRRRRLVTGVVAVLVAAGGMVVVARAFLSQEPSMPAGTIETGGYRFSDIALEPDTQHEEPNWTRVTYTLGWDPEVFPGVHRCLFSLYEAGGGLTGQHSVLFGHHLAVEAHYREVVPPREQGRALRYEGDRPVRVGLTCGDQRFDAPGIAVPPEPWPDEFFPAESVKVLFAEVDRRVQRWAREFDVEAMTDEQRAANMLVLWASMSMISERTGPALEVREVFGRMMVLCQGLPPDHEFRGGEFCT
jgi:hypothetical protein